MLYIVIYSVAKIKGKTNIFKYLPQKATKEKAGKIITVMCLTISLLSVKIYGNSYTLKCLSAHNFSFPEEAMANNFKKSAAGGKTRSKAAKTVLWVLLGCVAATLLVMLIMFIIAAAGGTGTSYGGILGQPFNACTTVLTFFAIVLVLAWLLTEPSFKKVQEEEENHDLDYRTQYVKKAAKPHPMAGKTNEAEKPTEETKAE